MKAPYQIVGVVGLFLSSLPNASEAQQSRGEEMEALHRQVAQMQLAGRQLQNENQELKADKILLQQENQALKLERAELQKSQREAISLANTSQMNQQALLAEVTALRGEVAKFREMLDGLLLQRKPPSTSKPPVARDPRDPFAAPPAPTNPKPPVTPPTAPRTEPPTTGKDPFGG